MKFLRYRLVGRENSMNDINREKCHRFFSITKIIRRHRRIEINFNIPTIRIFVFSLSFSRELRQWVKNIFISTVCFFVFRIFWIFPFISPPFYFYCMLLATSLSSFIYTPKIFIFVSINVNAFLLFYACFFM